MYCIVNWSRSILEYLNPFNLMSSIRLAKSIFAADFSSALAKKFFIVLCTITLLLICGDVELNPGRKITKLCYNFSWCHWNLKMLLPIIFQKYRCSKLAMLNINLGIIGISEKYLDSRFPDDDPRLNLPGADNLNF